VVEVFLSYRTYDSAHATSAISAELALHLGRVAVFRDRDSLALGSQYPKQIRAAVARCDKLLAVIGPHWLTAQDAAGNRRIDLPADWVRSELRTAFALGIPVVPLLLDDTPLPTRHQLPADISDLSVSTAWRIREQTLVADVRALIAKLAPAAVVPNQPTKTGGGQYNSTYGDGAIYAVQGGNQTINVTEPKRGADD
jgi:hypothetical protein